ncbi:MAG: hypothetical protein KDC80_19070 [Saprospiraceae bacterium]|nr:hypothetical protein [Saprospiraceae bacterium]
MKYHQNKAAIHHLTFAFLSSSGIGRTGIALTAKIDRFELAKDSMIYDLLFKIIPNTTANLRNVSACRAMITFLPTFMALKRKL